jgi:hypothetical protein
VASLGFTAMSGLHKVAAPTKNSILSDFIHQLKLKSCLLKKSMYDPGLDKGHAGDLEKQAAQRHGLNFNPRMCSSGVGCVTT